MFSSSRNKTDQILEVKATVSTQFGLNKEDEKMNSLLTPQIFKL